MNSGNKREDVLNATRTSRDVGTLGHIICENINVKHICENLNVKHICKNLNVNHVCENLCPTSTDS